MKFKHKYGFGTNIQGTFWLNNKYEKYKNFFKMRKENPKGLMIFPSSSTNANNIATIFLMLISLNP